ncbi:hypothetical protein [Desmospora activa]|uniref:Uncharacterized protein n=1 Tax=Desmospora activa DSM 45169 TaxID=1121389 RepID=A0A2T4Z9U7_9BACL|nr:hypothetical protein [Desmospora activa]PTM58661.1 hypothetical protein C8J48_1248 [Desmospora activa DSM 45169]
MWVPGSMALIAALSLAVLVQTGWFQGLEKDLSISRGIVGVFMLLQSSLTFAYVPLGTWVVHIGTLLWLGFFPFLWRGVRSNSSVAVFAALMMVSSCLLLLQEWLWLKSSTSWGDIPGTWLAITLPVAMITSTCLYERMLIGGGGTMLAEFLRLLIHRDELSPVILGESAWLDRFWLVLSGIFLFHYALRWISVRMGNPNPSS